MKVYEPKCRVTLVKSRRRRSLGASAATGPALLRLDSLGELDLTPYLSDQGGVRTQKSVRGGVGGFALTLEDRPVFGDSVYGLIEPQDLIEIRMARTRSGELPLVMRGLVSSVSRSRSIEGGRPVRLVRVAGQDFGKVLQQLRIYYLPGSVTGDVWLDQFKFFRKFDGAAKVMQADAFLELVCNNVINPYIQKMLALVEGRGLPVALPSGFVPESSIQGIVSPIGVAAFEGGSVQDLLVRFLDVGPFNELYVDDRETTVALVCRPAPWKDQNGTYIQAAPDSARPATVTVDDQDVVSESSTRTDSGVANYFWCSAGRWELQNNGTLQLLALSNKSAPHMLFDYVNTSVDLYGLRKMEVESQLGDPLQLSGDGIVADKLPSEASALSGWLAERRRVLALSNADNVVLESGSLRIKGNEAMKAGRYVDVTRGTLVSTLYAVSVSHEFTPGSGFFTTIDYERGTGFVQRLSRNASPWIDERNENGAT